MKYKKITNIKQYNKYCDQHAKLFEKGKAKDKDEIELLEILIEEYENRVSKIQLKDFNPVELLKSMLVANNLTQVEFSKALNVSPQLINDILNFRRNISKSLVVKFANFFSMSQEAFSRPYKLHKKVVSIQKYPVHADEVLDTLKEGRRRANYKRRKKSSKKKVIKTETVLVKSVSTKNKKPKGRDDLKKISRIGKKMESILNAADIFTYAQLAKTSKKRIKEILANQGIATKRYNAEEWPKKAKEVLLTN